MFFRLPLGEGSVSSPSKTLNLVAASHISSFSCVSRSLSFKRDTSGLMSSKCLSQMIIAPLTLEACLRRWQIAPPATIKRVCWRFVQGLGTSGACRSQLRTSVHARLTFRCCRSWPCLLSRRQVFGQSSRCSATPDPAVS